MRLPLIRSRYPDPRIRGIEAISDHYPKIIVSMDEVQLPSKNGISHVQAWNFETYLQNFR